MTSRNDAHLTQFIARAIIPRLDDLPLLTLYACAASETMLTIAADPKHLGARIGITAVLHTWRHSA